MVITQWCVMRGIIRLVRRPSCFGSMYELGEEHMAENCMRCPAFNKCSKIGGGVEVSAVSLPREPDTWGELEVKW